MGLLLPSLAFLALAVTNALLLPWFEPPDEKYHLHYAQYLARERRLPDMNYVPVVDTPETVRTAANPPFYYMIAALFLDSTVPYLSPQVRWSPHDVYGYWGQPTGGWAPYGNMRARLGGLRALSIVFGLLTVWACYGTGRLLSPDDSSLAAAMAWFPVSLPQFVAISAAVNTEALAVALLSTGVWAALAAAPRQSGRLSLLAGALFGLSIMTKMSGLYLLPACALILWRGSGPGHRNWRGLALATAALALLSVPWILRNSLEYSDPIGSRCFLVSGVHGTKGFPTSVAGWAKAAAVVFCSFYACYGQLSAWLPRSLYALPAGLALLSVLGWRRAFREDTGLARSMWWSSTLAVGAMLGVCAIFTARVWAPQGRYLFVGMVFLAFLFARGLLAWLPSARRTVAAHSLGCAMVIAQAVYLWRIVAPAYRP